MSTSIVEVLGDAQRRGFLGPGSIERFVDHALGYLEGFPSQGDVVEDETTSCVDLGSGGGIPGLVLALELPASRWTLVDRSRARADWLTRSVTRLGLHSRVEVRHQAAERTGRGSLRGSSSVVVARSFGRPAVAAECAAPLLRVGGRAIFSDLDELARWDEAALSELGLVLLRQWTTSAGTYISLEQQVECPDRFPRAAGVPARRPLF